MYRPLTVFLSCVFYARPSGFFHSQERGRFFKEPYTEFRSRINLEYKKLFFTWTMKVQDRFAQRNISQAPWASETELRAIGCVDEDRQNLGEMLKKANFSSTCVWYPLTWERGVKNFVRPVVFFTVTCFLWTAILQSFTVQSIFTVKGIYLKNGQAFS